MLRSMWMSNPSERSLKARFAETQPFPLDLYQREAVDHLAANRSVLVSAPTGAGKTVIAEFAVFAALERGLRCVYTTPLKALSNQKYRDLKERLPGQVGLMTGDVVIDPDAPVLIMTTEILRNMLQADPERVADVSHVVLDEAHYIGSEGRGTVWEETIVFLGKDTLVVALSATIPNAEELATWVSEVHRPMAVVAHAERPVPLETYVATPGINRLFDQRGRVAVRQFNAGGWVELPDPVAVIKGLKTKNMLPAIYFIFSRMGCEQHAQDLIKADMELNSKNEQMAVHETVQDAIRATPGLLGSASSRRWMEDLPQGVAPHHAGLLPPLKLLIEKLFQRGLIKAVFATETLAAGINMPARTVVISNLIKRTDDGLRMLTVGEFHQMTGRAGRRGMDKVGYGVVLASHRYSPLDVARLVKDAVEPLRSRFTLNFNMVANLTHRYDPKVARRIVEQSFAAFQNDTLIAHLVERKRLANASLTEVDLTCPVEPPQQRPELLELHGSRKSKRDSLKKRLSGLQAARRYMPRPQVVNTMGNVAVGSWLLVHQPGRPRPELAVLLAKQLTRNGDVHFTVLTDLPALVRLGSQHLVMALPVAPVRGLPAEVIARAGMLSYLQHLKPGKYQPSFEKWQAESGINLEDYAWTLQEAQETEKVRIKLDTILRDLAGIPCTGCRLKFDCEDLVERHQHSQREANRVSEEIEHVRSTHWREFQALVSVLEGAEYMRGRELLARGVAIANIRTTNELMAAECIAGGFLEGLSPVEMASVVSCIVAEPPRGRQSWHPMPLSNVVYEVGKALATIGRDLIRLQRKFEVEQPIFLEREYAGLVQAWAQGAEWSGLIAATGIDEGQLVRHFRQVIDMLQQLREVPGGTPAFRQQTKDAVALIDRDIVHEVF